MITPDYIAPWLAFPVGALALALYFYLGIKGAAPDPDPESLTGLDVLERTGSHPG